MVPLLAFQLSFAKDTWIQVVGIDAENTAQNYTEFYLESENFSKTCRQNSNRNCIKYINPNTSLAKDPESISNIHFNSVDNIYGTRDSINLYNKLYKLISNAQNGDQILIALQNHGSPSTNSNATSCIYISSTEKLCDREIKSLLTKAPKGVKIAIFADGCYSGGFAQLASKDQCVVVSADQYSIGYAGTTHFWEAINRRKVKKLSDFKGMYETGGSSVKAASQVMKDNRCQIFNSSIQESISEEDWELIDFLVYQLKRVNTTCDREFNTTIYDDLRSISDRLNRDSYARQSEKITNKLCNPNTSNNFTQHLCGLWKSILQLPHDEINLVQQVAKKTGFENAQKNFEKIKEDNLHPEFLNKIVNGLYLHAAIPTTWKQPDMSQLTTSQRSTVLAKVKQQQVAYQKLKAAEHKFQLGIETLKVKINDQDLKTRELIDCLKQPETSSVSPIWDAIARTKEKLFFSDDIIEEARKCEESFSLQ